MILALHAVTGAVAASGTKNIFIAAILGLISHYFLDTIAHTDYDMGKVENGEITMSKTAPFKIAADLVIGILVVYYSLQSGRLHNEISVLIGAFFGMLPDGLAFLDLHITNKNKNVLTRLLTKHRLLHDKIHLEAGQWPLIQYLCQAIVVLLLIYFIFK